MFDYQPLFQALSAANAQAWVDLLPHQLAQAFDVNKHGALSEWQRRVENLPFFNTAHRVLTADVIEIGRSDELSIVEKVELEAQLKQFMPWRKGPYNLFGVHIDTEWRSDWKWRRLQGHIALLKDRLVLDVGCGSGYHCWRMLGEQAKLVVGIDPLMLNVMQFQLIRKLYGEQPPIYVLPLGLEALPASLKIFDTVFSMGVLYHRRSPIDHLLELRNCLRTGGELVLETLIIDGNENEVLVPESRYANMRNVWFIPSCAALMSWLRRCGFDNIRLLDITVTSVAEQRSTEWMTFNSLQDFLTPGNPALTIEGLPAPKRAIFLAESL
jgi:tRNA (mo5U34)-methyltransferase